MKHALHLALLSALALCTSALAADPSKTKVIDAFTQIDAKTIKAAELKIRITNTPDPAHKTALEMVADFAKPGSYPRLTKILQPGLLDPKKYSGIKVAFKSDTESEASLSLRGDETDADGKNDIFHFRLKGRPEWQETVVPFSAFKTIERKSFKNGVQKVFPGNLPIPPEAYPELKQICFSFTVARRGNSDKAVFLVGQLELVAP